MSRLRLATIGGPFLALGLIAWMAVPSLAAGHGGGHGGHSGGHSHSSAHHGSSHHNGHHYNHHSYHSHGHQGYHHAHHHHGHYYHHGHHYYGRHHAYYYNRYPQYGERYYYGDWVADGNRQYICYWYKADPNDTDYRCHYLMSYATRPGKVYFYSPYSQVFYGYYDSNEGGYHYLAPEARRGMVSEIPASAWSTKPYQLPVVPGAKDGEQMPMPPAPPV